MRNILSWSDGDHLVSEIAELAEVGFDEIVGLTVTLRRQELLGSGQGAFDPLVST
jgi:hypothetical protein